MSFEIDPDYKEVSERIQDFREKHPDGSLQAEIVPAPFDGFVAVRAYAYRTPDDPRPGVGLAWEPVPGSTPFTKNSELMNAETSAWGRAIIAVGASDAKRVSSANEVRNRRDEPATQPQPPADAGDTPPCPNCNNPTIHNPKWEKGTKRPHYICGSGCKDGKWPVGVWKGTGDPTPPQPPADVTPPPAEEPIPF